MLLVLLSTLYLINIPLTLPNEILPDEQSLTIFVRTKVQFVMHCVNCVLQDI